MVGDLQSWQEFSDLNTTPGPRKFSSLCARPTISSHPSLPGSLDFLLMCHVQEWNGPWSHRGYGEEMHLLCWGLGLLPLFPCELRRAGLASGQPTAYGYQSLLLAQLPTTGILGRQGCGMGRLRPKSSCTSFRPHDQASYLMTQNLRFQICNDRDDNADLHYWDES